MPGYWGRSWSTEWWVGAWFFGRRMLIPRFGSPSMSFGTRKCDYFKRIPWFSRFWQCQAVSGRVLGPCLRFQIRLGGVSRGCQMPWQGFSWSGLGFGACLGPGSGFGRTRGLRACVWIRFHDVDGCWSLEAWMALPGCCTVLRELPYAKRMSETCALSIHWCGEKRPHLLEWAACGADARLLCCPAKAVWMGRVHVDFQNLLADGCVYTIITCLSSVWHCQAVCCAKVLLCGGRS